jgi:hypothetical protein
MYGDNAKTLNPMSRAEKQQRQRARIENACGLIEVQLEAARSGTHAKREDALRRMLGTLLLCLPRDLAREKKEQFVTNFLQSVYDDADEFYDMPHISVDGDLVNVQGNFSLRKLSKRFMW